MHRSRNTHSKQTHRPSICHAWFGGLDPLPGDEKLGKQPTVVECFSTMTRKQFVGAFITALVIAALGFAILSGSFALAPY